MAPANPGDTVRVIMTKWGGQPHWEFDCSFLGSDARGDWLGIAAGTRMARPGASYVAPTNQLALVPAPGPDDARGWLATFHDVGGPLRLYVDITTPPIWDGPVVRAVDLDLDVICDPTGRVWVDDEDEFADHRVRFGYPDDVADGAIRSCDLVHAQVLGGHPPYGGDSATPWLTRLADLLAR